MCRHCKLLVGELTSSYLPILIDLFNSGCTACDYTAAFKGASAAANDAWQAHMNKSSWMRLCQQLGSPAIDKLTAVRVFAGVNERRDVAVEKAKISLLHRGHGISTSQELMVQSSMALNAKSFSLSEFIEACVACAPIVAGKSLKGLEPMAQAQAAVVQFLDGFIVPHAKRVGLAGFRDALSSLPTLSSARVEMAPLMSQIWKTHAAAAKVQKQLSGGALLGLSLGRFLDIAELIDPEMPRARVKAVFLAALGVSLHMPTDTSTRLLGQDSAWEGIVRLALLQIANTSTSLPDVAPPPPVGAPPSRQAQAQNAKELSGAELACSLTEMSKAQLRDLRSALQQMEARVIGPKADEAVVKAAAAKALQSVARGKASRMSRRASV